MSLNPCLFVNVWPHTAAKHSLYDQHKRGMIESKSRYNEIVIFDEVSLSQDRQLLPQLHSQYVE